MIDEACVHFWLDSAHAEQPIDLIIHGDGGRRRQGVPIAGVDLWAGTWADWRGVPCMVFPAAWNGLKNPAGPIRNKWQIKFGQPTECHWYPGGQGTRNMVEQATRAGIKIVPMVSA